MCSSKLKSLLIMLLPLFSNILSAQNTKCITSVKLDSTYTSKFDWHLENESRNDAKSSYAKANMCSRWIKFSDQDFAKLKKMDGKMVIFTIKRSVYEGLESMKTRGVNTDGVQATSKDFECYYVVNVRLH